jgi:hypothetical protein
LFQVGYEVVNLSAACRSGFPKLAILKLANIAVGGILRREKNIFLRSVSD